MNERIRELAKQSGAWQYYEINEGVGEDEKHLEKFAQLIVRECATAITDNEFAKDCGTFLMDSYAKGMRYSAHLIKEHFGVEE
jgi:hypothetical protein